MLSRWSGDILSDLPFRIMVSNDFMKFEFKVGLYWTAVLESQVNTGEGALLQKERCYRRLVVGLLEEPEPAGRAHCFLLGVFRQS